MKKVELLAPVGKIENAYAAIENGADAIFVGGKLFSARQYADNFTHEELEEILRYARLRAVKVYVTVNTLIKEEEITALFNYLEELRAIGVDAVISQDFSVVHLVRHYFPELTLHASTQMSAHSIEDVKFLKSLGFKRVVLARELTLKEVKAIIETCDIEIETFIHGALCYSYSGQCLMSSLIGGRSGNRGRCAQPCRMKYMLIEEGQQVSKENYLLSLKDMCSLEFLPELVKAGIHSFKVEGRMKSPEYVASVIGTYRKYLDAVYDGIMGQVEEKDFTELKEVFNRGGFSKGYYFGGADAAMVTPISPKHIGIEVGKVTQFSPKNKRAAILLTAPLSPGDGIEIVQDGRESVGAGISKVYHSGETLYLQFDKFVEVGSRVYLTKNHQLLKTLRNTYAKLQRTIPVDVRIVSKVGEPTFLEMQYENFRAEHKGEALVPAEKVPVTREMAVKQLTKFGNTSFRLGKLDMDWDEKGYLPTSKLNEMRRAVIEKLQQAILVQPVYPKPIYQKPEKKSRASRFFFAANVTTLGQLKACLEMPQIEAIYWEDQGDTSLWKEASESCRQKGVKCYLALPYVMHEAYYKTFRKSTALWEISEIEGYLIRTIGQFNRLKNSLKAKHIDYTLNIMNNETIALWQSLGADQITVSVEISGAEIHELQGNLQRIVYGSMPVMTTKQCLLSHHGKCLKGKSTCYKYKLQDRKGAKWPVRVDCRTCTMQLLTEKPLVIKSSEELKSAAGSCLRLIFVEESQEETREVLQAFLSGDPQQIKQLSGVSFKSIE